MISRLYRQQYIFASGCIVIICGCVDLAGWQFNIPQFRTLIPGVTAMNPVVAVTFILCGLWLLLFEKKRLRYWLFAICCVVTLMGIAHSVTYIYPLNIRIDYLLYKDKIAASLGLNYIAPNTAILFTMAGISMCKVHSRKNWVEVLRQGLIMTGFALVYISLLGYLYDIKPAYRLEGFTPMAIFTAVTFLVLYTGLFLSNVETGMSRMFVSSLNGSRFFRRVLLFMLLFPPLTGYLRLVGERRGFFPTEFGVELNTLLFTFIVLVLVILYASAENRKELAGVKAERQLAASELKFRTIFNSLKEGVGCLDYDGRLLYCNPSYCNILGYTEKELLGQVIIDKIIPEREKADFYRLLEDRRAGKVVDYQALIMKKNGERIWIDIKSTTMRDSDGNAYGYLVSVNDITEERLKVEDLRTFSGSAAHDLNAPLNRIIQATELLMSDSLDAEERKMFLSAISDTAGSMKQLLQDLLTFSRLTSVQLEKTEVDIDKIVREICAALTPENYKGEIIIHPLPPANGNEGAIRQLFTNLISNAIKYSSKKQHPRVEIGYNFRDRSTAYYIKDNGVGLSKEQLGTLFTPFKRYHADFEGNGLGLAIVKRVVEKHSGAIWAESEPGNGLAFHFILEPNVRN